MDLTYSRKQIVDFLRSVSIMSASTIAPDGPVNSVLLFAVDDDLTMYFSTHSDSRKAKALSTNPKIALSIWNFDEMLVQAEGEVTQIEDAKEIDEVFDKLVLALKNTKDFWPPVLHIEGESYCLFKIKLDRMTLLPLKNLTIHDYRNSFIQVEI